MLVQVVQVGHEASAAMPVRVGLAHQIVGSVRERIEARELCKHRRRACDAWPRQARQLAPSEQGCHGATGRASMIRLGAVQLSLPALDLALLPNARQCAVSLPARRRLRGIAHLAGSCRKQGQG